MTIFLKLIMITNINRSYWHKICFNKISTSLNPLSEIINLIYRYFMLLHTLLIKKWINNSLILFIYRLFYYWETDLQYASSF